ncbi:AT-hook motif nuclear-localized protein 28-like [Miscanthus floridulus]|uniref:AT-hook motif nuclear-localized protein 28-like n=1 Tax=Miscanthus floridulus TaxID=154761 RepID=UPI0034593386
MDREEGLYGGRGDGSSRLLVVQDLHQPMECFSDEVNSRNGCGEEEEEEEVNDGSGSASRPPPAPNGAGAGGDGPASVETGGKRRRGRPPGSKNKKKPPPVVTRDVEPAAAMRPHVLEIHSGGDVARALAGFARRRGLGICVLAGTGAVADVSLRHPASASSADGGAAAVVVFRGRYEILSISATFLAPSMSAAVPRSAGAVSKDLSISLAGPHGQIVGGAVVGPLVAATTVVVLAAAFTDLTFHRLPLEDDASAASVSGSGAEADEHRHRGHGHQQPPEHHDASGLHPQTMVAPAATQPVPLYARQSQELWPPAATAQRPRPPPYQ